MAGRVMVIYSTINGLGDSVKNRKTDLAIDPVFALRACCDKQACQRDGFVSSLLYTPS